MDITDRRNRRYAAVLALLAGAILVAGWLLRPRQIAESPAPVPSDSELQELSRLTQRRSLESVTAYFAGLAADASSSLAYVPSADATGVAWDATRIVTGPLPSSAAMARLVVRTAFGDRRADAVSSRRVPVSVLMPDAETRVAARAPSMPGRGDWVLAVWQTDRGRAYAAANFGQTSTVRCGPIEVRELATTLSLTRAMIGGGLFNLDRQLLAVILPCGDHVAAVERDGVEQLLARAIAIDERLLTRYGVLFDDPSAADREPSAAVEGLFVREVWHGTSADAADVRPGDVLVAINEQPVASIDDLRPLLTPTDEKSTLQFRRGSSVKTVVLNPDTSPEVASETGTGLGLAIAPGPAPYRIETVEPQSAAARAGARPGDVVLRINHVELQSRTHAERAINSQAATPILLEVQRDQRRIAILIPANTSR